MNTPTVVLAIGLVLSGMGMFGLGVHLIRRHFWIGGFLVFAGMVVIHVTVLVLWPSLPLVGILLRP